MSVRVCVCVCVCACVCVCVCVCVCAIVTGVVDRAGVDLTVVSPAHPDGAAALLLRDVGGEDAVAEHRVVQVQVALLLILLLYGHH